MLGLAALLAARQVDAPDVGFHLRAGEYVLENGWPRTDPFSFTMREHEYLATSWAYEVLLAWVEHAGGPAALVLLHVGLVAATFAVLWLTARLAGSGGALALPLFLMSVLASELRFSVRPELLSYLLLASLAYLLHRHAQGRRTPLWILPLLFLVWVNCHSLFILGGGLLACCLLGSFFDAFTVDRRLLGWSLASAVACFANPYGWKGVLLPQTLLTRFEADSLFGKAILEYASPFNRALDAGPSFPWLPFWSFRVFALLALLAALGLVFRGRWWCALAILVFAWPATRMIRNMPILVVVGFAPALWGLDLRAAHAPWLRRAAAVAVAAAALVLALRVRTDAYYGTTRRWERTGFGWNPSTLPIEAVEYLVQSGIDGRGLNHLNVGGWLMWRGRVPVFIDGRLEVVGEEFFAEHQRAFSSVEALEECAERWDSGWTLFAWPFLPELLTWLSADPRWTLVHADPLSVLFVRSDRDAAQRPNPRLAERLTPAPGAILDLPGFPGGPPRAGPATRWLAGLVRPQTFPRGEYQMARFHLLRGETELAAERYTAAIRGCAGLYVELYEGLGEALLTLERWHEASDSFQVVLQEHPGDLRTRRRLKDLETKLAE